MRISTKGRYAVRLMLDLAICDVGDPVRIKDIAQRQEISEKYLEQIISLLHKAGLVKSIRGPQGGYRLTREPRQYTIGMILRVTEGSLAPVACLEGDENECHRKEQCATIKLWMQLDEAIRGVVDTVTIEDLMEWNGSVVHDYMI